MRSCKNCGESLESINSSRVFCDESCKNEFYEIGEYKICPFCGENFIKTYKDQKYCTVKCRYGKRDMNRKELVTVSCECCGEITTVIKNSNENICEKCKKGENMDKVPLGRTGSNIFVPGIENEHYGLVNPAL